MDELQREWHHAFPPAQADSTSPPESPPSPFAIADKAFLLITPMNQQLSTLTRSILEVRNYPDPMRRAHEACVKVITPTRHGAGIVVSPHGDILTSYHLVTDAPGVAILTLDGQVFSVTNILACSVVYDLALIKIPADTPVFLPPDRTAPIPPGTRLGIVGHPSRQSWQWTTGAVIRRNDEGATHLLHFESDVGPGNSGGPIIDETGRLCALTACAATLEDGSKVKVGVDVETLRQFLNAPHVATSFAALAVQDKDRRIAGVLGTLYVVMGDWLRQWADAMSAVGIEANPSASGSGQSIRLVNTRRTAELSTRLLVLRTLLDTYANTEGLSPSLAQSTEASITSIDTLINGLAELPTTATPARLKEAIPALVSCRRQAEQQYGRALSEFGDRKDIPQQNRLELLRKHYSPAGCRVETAGAGG